MTSRKRHDLVFAIHIQSRGFAFVLFDRGLFPVDWGVHEVRGANKNARCLEQIASLFELHTPDVLVLQDMSDRGTPRAPRIQELNRRTEDLAHQLEIAVRRYPRAQVMEHFAQEGATTKHSIAERIANRVPALALY